MKFLRPLVLLTLLLGMWLPLRTTQAAPLANAEVQSFSQIDIDNDGRVDQAVIECACVTSHDQILVFDGAADMVASTDWNQGTDTSNDIWIFNIQATDQAKLIIVFQSEGTQQSALLYDDVNGDGMVAYHIAGKSVVIDESPYWVLKVTAFAGWNSINQPGSQLQAWLDKPPDLLADSLKKYTPHDGKPDWDFELADFNNDGIPDYALSRIIAPIPQQYLLGRTGLLVNSSGTRPQRSATALFWPFLDLNPASSNLAFRIFDLLPSVVVDWRDAQIVTFKLPGLAMEDGYSINSFGLLDKSQIYDATFEVPHAYYDLAANHDNYPELNIRLHQIFVQPWQEIRYSWNQFNPGTFRWDYKVGLMGYFPVDSVVNVADLKIRMVPYEQLPYWVTDKKWQLTTFVAREFGLLQSNEGIYAWSPYAGEDPTNSSNPSADAINAAETYLSGRSDTPPYVYFTNIWEGYRGEYNFVHPLQTILYFSPVDQRLHLKGAEAGLLNLGQERSVVYANTDGDDYIDQWTLFDGTNQFSRLSIGPSYILYSDATRVILKWQNIPFSTFETLPPRNNSEWQSLGQELVSPDKNIESQDFLSMLSQFSGPEWIFNEATSSDFRNLDQGCRFILTVSPGYSGTGANGAALSKLNPGKYLIEFNRGTFTVHPVTPAPLVVEFVPSSGSSFQVYDQVGLRTRISNPGLEDITGATFILQARNAGNTTTVLTQPLNLMTGESRQIEASWQPASAGQWDLDAFLADQSGNRLGGAQTSLNVAGQTVSPLRILSVTSPVTGLPLLILLVTAALVCGLVFSAAWSSKRRGDK